MSTGNPNYGVGGTAQDGGLSTADTVADGGPDSQKADPSYAGDSGKASSGTASTGKAGPGNPNYNVGGTAKDGGVSTEATVADGGPDDKEADPDFKPS